MTRKRREKVSSILLEREREDLEKKAGALDELAELVTEIDHLHCRVVEQVAKLGALGMKRNSLIEMLKPSIIATRMIKTPLPDRADSGQATAPENDGLNAVNDVEPDQQW